MNSYRLSGALVSLFAMLCLMGGCSHAVLQNNNGGGGQTAPVILTIHDTPASGITIVSFEVTVTGASLTPTGGTAVSLVSTPQKLELTQLQANSAFLASKAVNVGTFSSLTLTLANPQFTFVNDSGSSITVGTVTCAVGATCVVTPTISGSSTITFSGAPLPLQVMQSQQNLLEVDFDLNNIVQSDFSVNFGATGAASVTKTQTSVVTGTTSIGSFALNGSITSLGTNNFQFAASTGQAFTVAVNAGTSFNFSAACTANNFSCLGSGQLVNVQLDILSDGTLEATAIGFDDVSGTQQLTGEIVALNGTPPTSFAMVLHNTVPSLAGAPVGAPITVTIPNTASFGINNFTQLPPVSFATPSDLLVGQEVEARLSGTFTAGPPAAFTTDRIMLDPSQVTATVSQVSIQAQMFTMNQLPSLFTSAQTNAFTQVQVDAGASFGTVFENLSSNDLTSLLVGHHAAVAGFLFNTIGTTGSPTIVATVVRDDGP